MKVMHKVISLTTAKERRRHIRRSFESAEVEFEFFDAIDGRISNSEMDFSKPDSPYHRQLSGGEIGCYLSHLSVINEFFKSDAKFIVIYEDDIEIPKDFGPRFNGVLQSFKNVEEPSIWFIGYRNECASLWGRKKIFGNVIAPISDFVWGAHAYLLNKKAAKIILDIFNAPIFPFDCVTGGYHSRYKEFKNIGIKRRVLLNKLVDLNELLSNSSMIGDRYVNLKFNYIYPLRVIYRKYKKIRFPREF